jgi:hypothetical protein
VKENFEMTLTDAVITIDNFKVWLQSLEQEGIKEVKINGKMEFSFKESE